MLAGACEPRGQHEAGGYQTGEPDARHGEMDESVPADLADTFRSARRKTIRRVGTEHPRRNQADAEAASRPEPHADRRPGPRARRTPSAAAIVIAPVTRKLAI